MTSEERRETLADAAAAWVPPWDRPAASAATAAGEAATDEPEAPTGEPRVSTDEPGIPTEEPPPEDAPVDEPIVEQRPATETPEGERPTGEMPDGGALPTPAEDEPGAPVDVPASESPAAPESPPASETGESAYGEQALFDVPGAHLDDASLRGALEAILLVVDEPVPDVVLAQVLEQPVGRVTRTLEQVATELATEGRGFDLRRAAGGWRLYTRPEYAAYVERFVLDGQSVRLTQAALETLAVVAYKQPVTRSRVAAVRGVNSDGVMRTLVSRGLIEECGTEPDSGAFLYRTTPLFLEKLGLDSVDDLPPLAPFLPDDVEDLADAAR